MTENERRIESEFVKGLRYIFPEGPIYEERDIKKSTTEISLIRCPKCGIEDTGYRVIKDIMEKLLINYVVIVNMSLETKI